MTTPDYDDDDLIYNPTPRCPCLLVLDTSASMEGDSIAELNRGVQTFLREIAAHTRARDAVEVGVITFGSTVTEVLDFTSPEDAVLEPLTTDGRTAMGAAVRRAIRRLRERRERYKAAGVSSYVPWLVLMTDGKPTDPDWEDAAQELRQIGEQRKLVVFGVGIGASCDFDDLARFCPADRPPLRLADYNFQQFFHFMSRSLETVVSGEDAEGGFTIPPLVEQSEDDRKV